MNYEETLDYLYNAAPAFEKVGAGAYKEGLTTTRLLDAHFNHPHTRYKTIHVAGTNGKGSVSHTFATMLQLAGYRVGLYTSPHLVDFNERIKVNGEPISHDYVVKFVEKEKGYFEPLSPSFFEITTAMAFKYFADQKVDIAVIEVGLGGRLDCTNIITPLLSVITNISFDHTSFLGNSLAQIASEKAGIIKPGVPVVIGEHTEETKGVFLQKAAETNSPIFFAQECQYVISSHPVANGCRSYSTRCYGDFVGALGGECQEKNVNTILNSMLPLAKALKQNDMLGGQWQETESYLKLIHSAFANVTELSGLMGRWQVIKNEPLAICDTGHNLAGWQYLSIQINETYKQRQQSFPACKLRIVFGMVDDKDVDAVMELLPRNAEYYFTQAFSHRAIPASKISAKAKEKGLTGKVYHTVKEAYNEALNDSSETDFVFVGGSSYVVADLLS